MNKTFVCKSEKCAKAGQPQEVSEGDFGLLAGEPECPCCGDKDSFQAADDIRTHLPESPQLCQALVDCDGDNVAACSKPMPCHVHPAPPEPRWASPQIKHPTDPPVFVVKDSGKRQDFATGARRDTQDGKGDFSRLPPSWLLALAKELQSRNEPNDRLDLVPVSALLRLSAVYGKGSTKYDDPPTTENPKPTPNWQRGIPMSRYVSSLNRHLVAYAEGDQSEDHLAQAMWNAAGLLWTDEQVRAGKLPRDLGDWGPLINPNCKTAESTGIAKEPGGAPILPLKKGVPLCRFDIVEGGAEKVALRRGGAVLVGWVLSPHLETLDGSR